MAELVLTKGFVALVDDADLEWLSQWRWSAVKCGGRTPHVYACRFPQKLKGETGPGRIYLHRVLTGAGKGQVVDHINGDGLDNRRENLRACSQAQNCANTAATWSASGFRGVSYDRVAQKFVGKLRVQGRLAWWGHFDTAEEAAAGYAEASRRIHGEFSRFNSPAEECRIERATHLSQGWPI